MAEIEILWLKNFQNLLKIFNVFQITTSKVSGDFPHMTMLQISDVTTADLGSYVCAGSNNIGDSTVTIDLTVKSM